MKTEFKMNTYAWKPITESGSLSYYSGQYNINYSSILSKLIQEAGRYCEAYASDLFIDWQAVLRCIENTSGCIMESFLFGFRKYGVDHKEYVFNRDNPESEYRSLWRLDINADGKIIEMILGRVF